VEVFKTNFLQYHTVWPSSLFEDHLLQQPGVMLVWAVVNYNVILVMDKIWYKYGFKFVCCWYCGY
jgi:hypothetical protein